MVLLPPCEEKCRGDDQGERLGHGDGEPDAVDAEELRQDQNCSDLNNERAQERNERAGRAVVEPREKRRAENIKAADEERERVKPQGVDRHRTEGFVVADEDTGNGRGERDGKEGHREARDERESQALFEQTFEFPAVLRAVVVANDGRDGDGITEEECHEDEADIHDNTVSAHTVLLRDGHELDVVEHADEGSRKVADHLARAVIAGLAKGAEVKARARQVQRRIVRAEEEDKRDERADDLRKRRGKRRAEKAEREHVDEQKIEHHVRQPREHRHAQAKVRLFRRRQKALEAVLQHEKGKRREQHAPIEHAVVDRQVRRTDGEGDGAQEDDAHATQNRAAGGEHDDEHGKDLVRLFGLALAERFGDERAAARADHKADSGERHDDGEDEVQRGERVFADEV